VIDKVNSGFPLPDATARFIAPRSKDSPEKIKKAAEQFEALMIGQMLKSSHEAGSAGWMGTGDDKAGQSGMDMAEQQFASLLASKGGLGLSRFITAGLAAK
jgi:Rod binding domain-containing protein